jgi:hypothetical protein
MAAPPAEGHDLTTAFKNWFSPKVSGATDLPDAYSDMRQDELKRPAVMPDRTTAKAILRKTEQWNKTAQAKPIRVELKSDGTQDHYLISAIGRRRATNQYLVLRGWRRQLSRRRLKRLATKMFSLRRTHPVNATG